MQIDTKLESIVKWKLEDWDILDKMLKKLVKNQKWLNVNYATICSLKGHVKDKTILGYVCRIDSLYYWPTFRVDSLYYYVESHFWWTLISGLIK